MSDLPSPRPDGEVRCPRRDVHFRHRWDMNEAGTWPEWRFCPGRKPDAAYDKNGWPLAADREEPS